MLVAAALALSLCSIGCDGSSSASITHTQNPLVAQYQVSAPAGSTAVVEFGPDTNYGFMTAAVPVRTGLASVLVAGMKQTSTYHMRAVITRVNGTKYFDADQVFVTGQAPADRIPIMSVTLPSGSRDGTAHQTDAQWPFPNGAFRGHDRTRRNGSRNRSRWSNHSRIYGRST